MGSEGSKRRKPKQRFPEVTEADRDPGPPIMWPDQGSGFEADPLSPAGEAQGIGRLLSGSRGELSYRGRQSRLVLIVTAGVVALLVAISVFSSLLH